MNDKELCSHLAAIYGALAVSMVHHRERTEEQLSEAIDMIEERLMALTEHCKREGYTVDNHALH